MDNQSPKQMMGQMFDSAAFHSNVELVQRYAPTQSEHTPYLGIMLDESMIQDIEAWLTRRLDTAIKGIKDHITHTMKKHAAPSFRLHGMHLRLSLFIITISLCRCEFWVPSKIIQVFRF